MSPVVSVVVATRNRASRLRDLLDSLRAQTFRDFEVIVCDDAFDDETPQVLAAAGGLSLTALRHATPAGAGGARNAALQHAQGDLVAFIDDDCIASPAWLEAGLRAWRADPSSFIQGPVGPIAGERDRLGAFSYTIIVDGPTATYECANIFYPRALLERLGGFADGYRHTGEDVDLGWRAREAGARPAFEQQARVEHAVVQLGIRGYVRRLWRWSYAMRAYADHPGLRAHLHGGIFWNLSHQLLARALLGVLLARCRWAWPLSLWLARWYVAYQLAESRTHAGTPWLAPWWVVRDVVEVAACVRGSVRYRTLVL